MPGRDEELLLDFTRTRSDRAFAELVGRHANWVYSAAVRSLGDPHRAEDVTQAVFLLLSRQPHKAVGKSLSGWLFKVMRYSVINTRRSEGRRGKHERIAAAMSPESREQTDEQTEEELWTEMVPLLEDLMARLRDRDRQVLLLRFYENQSLAEIAAVQGVTEDAARKRVTSALEKLRRLFRASGVIAPALTMSALLAARTVRAAPSAVIHALSGGVSAPTAAAARLASNIKAKMLVYQAWRWAASIALIAAILFPMSMFALHAMSPQPAPAAPATAIAASAPPVAPDPEFPLAVDFVIGQTRFQPGDGITITELRGTSDHFAIGNKYRVKGIYHLASRDLAGIGVYVSSNDPAADTGPFIYNRADIQRGDREFDLIFAVKTSGHPHVSFYPAEGGEQFGGVYFGNGDFLLK
jgi:RNA polymerase sigma factor (sigma-70 family)